VTEDRSSSGDPAATLRLLWRAQAPPEGRARRGPRRGTSVDAVVAAAVALADEEGIAAVTMRQLADRLGVGPMSVYTYVPGRAELLDLMLDDAYARMPRHQHDARPWQQRVRTVADDNHALYTRHPWAAHVSTLRPPLGPGQIGKYEHELAAFTGSGLDDLQIGDALTLLLTFVRANARDSSDASHTRQVSNDDDQSWWHTVGPLLADVLDTDTYPLASRIGAAAGAAHASAHDPGHAYTFGLDRIIDALAHLVSTSHSPAPPR